MSLSLGRICQLMENSALKSNKDDNLAIEAIKKGLDLRSSTKEGQTFWDDFMRISGNSKALGHLLGVDPIQVTKWRSRIHQYLKQVKADRKNDELNANKRHQMITTGDSNQADNSQGQMASGQRHLQGVADVAGSADNRDIPGMGNR